MINETSKVTFPFYYLFFFPYERIEVDFTLCTLLSFFFALLSYLSFLFLCVALWQVLRMYDVGVNF